MRDMHAKLPHPDLLIARVAAAQHGVVSVLQLTSCGISRNSIRHRLAIGRLHRVHRGVYAVGHQVVSRRGLWMAATLALGPYAVLSHRSAAELWGMLRKPTGMPHVTIPRGGTTSKRKGIFVHTSTSIGPRHVSRRDCIPVTTPARTIADLRRTEPEWLVRAAIRQAGFLGLPLKGVETDGTRSGLEFDYLGFFREIGIPKPQVNEPVGEDRPDFSWPEFHFAVETDGYKGHRTPEQIESDHGLGLRLARHGYELLRLTGRQLEEDREAIVEVLHMRLGRLPA